MTILLARYSGFPPEIFERGLVPKMSPAALRLYILLCRESDRRSNRQFPLKDKEVLKWAGASARSLVDARKCLQRMGLIKCRKDEGTAYVYELCDPNTGLPYPGDSKIRARYSKPVESDVRDPTSQEDVPLQSNTDDISFEYGCNALSDNALETHLFNPFGPKRF